MRAMLVAMLLGPMLWAQQPGLRRRTEGEARVASVREVVADVVVTDAKGRAVTGLGAADLRVSEDGVAQTVVGVVEHREGDSLGLGLRPLRTANTYTNRPGVFAGGQTTVILLDRVDASGVGLEALKEKLRGYLNRVPKGTGLAIFSLDTRLHTILPMTDDERAIGALRVSMAKDSMTLFHLDDVSGLSSDGLRQELLRVSMRELAEYWSAYPGRKNLLWLTGDVPLEMADGETDDPLADSVEVHPEGGGMVETTVLNRIAVYPLEVGQPGIPMMNVQWRGNGRLVDVAYTRTPEERWRAMEEIASRTGGRAFRRDRVEKDGIATAAGLGTHFYTVTYRTTQPVKEGWRRTLKIEAIAPGLVVDAPRSYVVRGVAAKGRATLSEVHARSMVRAALNEHAVPKQDLVFEVRVVDAGGVMRDGKQAAAGPGNALPAKLRQKGYRMYRMDYRADVSGMRFTQGQDGRYRHRLELYAMLYDEQGKLVNSALSKASEALEPGDYEALKKDGVRAAQMLAIPVKGQYTLRLGVFDPEGQGMGTVEVQVQGTGIRE